MTAMTNRHQVSVVITESIAKLCENRVFPVLEARGIECRQDGYSWLSSMLQSDELWAWAAQIQVPSPGEVYDVEIPKHGPPKIHDVAVQLDDAPDPNAEALRVEVIRVVGAHVYCKPTSAKPYQGSPAIAELLMISNRLFTLVVGTAPDRPILMADAIFANELTPMALLVQRPARMGTAGELGITACLLRKSAYGFGTPCTTCDETGQVSCEECGGTGKIPCKVCGGSGKVECRRCGGTGTFTGKYGDEMPCGSCTSGSRECPYCHGESSNNCPNCGGEGEVNCQDCYKHSGYRLVHWEGRTGCFNEIQFDESETEERPSLLRKGLGRKPVVLVEWDTGKASPINSNVRELFRRLHNNDIQSTSITEDKVLRLADHARRLSLFGPLLERLIEKQKVVEQQPIPFRGIEASAVRRGGQVVYEFQLDRPNGAWVKEQAEPFPKGTEILFVPRSNSSWRDTVPLRWVKGFNPETTGERLTASYIGKRRTQTGVSLQVAFPTAVDRGSIPDNGFLLASQPPPAEKTQHDHLRAWCGPNNRLNPVFQAVVFMDVPDSRPKKINLYDQTIQKTPSQYEAVRWGCSTSPLVLVKGPPGTGKTTVIVEIIRQLAAQSRKVLLCSQTHQAVRNVLERLHGEKRIRMSRHQSGREDSLSELERQYLAGAVADSFEKGTIECAQKSYELARLKWERDGAQLRALEAARDAASELSEARKRLPHEHAEIDVYVDGRIRELNATADNERAMYEKQNVARLQKLQVRLESLSQEMEWASSLGEYMRKRIQRMGLTDTDYQPVTATKDIEADVDASDNVVGHRYRRLFIKAQRHESREKALHAKALALEAELNAYDAEKEALLADIIKRAARAIKCVDDKESERALIAKESAVHKRCNLEKQNTQQRRELDCRIKKLKSVARAKVSSKNRAVNAAEAVLANTTKKKAAVAARYERVTGKRPRICEVCERSLVKRSMPLWMVGQEELQIRYSALRQTESNLQAKRNDLRTALVSARADLDSVVASEEAENATIHEAFKEQRRKIDESERQALNTIQRRAEDKKNGIKAAREIRIKSIIITWEQKRGEKPDRLESLRTELNLESEIMRLAHIGMSRLEPRISDRQNILKGTEHHALNEDWMVPDSEAGSEEKNRRIEECRRDIEHLLARAGYCEKEKDLVHHNVREAQDLLSQQIRRIDTVLVEEIKSADARRTENHAAVQAASDAMERRCRKVQADALGYAGDSMSDDEVPDKWEDLAVPIRPAALRLKEEFEFLRRWAQDITANAGVVQRLHWDNIDVFLSTCVGVASWRQLVKGGRDAVDTVIVDEAAHATLPETLIPMLYGNRCILIGDEMQLPPISMDDDLPPMPQEEWIAESELHLKEIADARHAKGTDAIITPSQNWLERSLFEWLYLYRPALPRQMLDKQFRMHPDIAGFISQVFYPEGLHDGVTRENRRLSFGHYTEAVCLIPTDSDPGRFQDKMGEKNGYRNKREAEIVLQILKEAEQFLDLDAYRQNLAAEILNRAGAEPDAWPEQKLETAKEEALRAKPSFGVITPYAQQKKLIREYLKDDLPALRNLEMSADEDVGSVDSYQGSERDVIIISFVRSPRPIPCRRCNGKGVQNGVKCVECKGLGWQGEDFSFVRDLRRLNVAFSRAKRMLILIGDFRALVAPNHRGSIAVPP